MNRLTSTLVRSAATIAIVILALGVATWMWKHYERNPWTRDGRVRAEVVRVTPDIPGLITSVAVKDNQLVKAGDLLFVIDTPRYALALQQANAQVAAARATLAQARRTSNRDVALGDLVATETHEQNLASVATAQAALAQAVSGRDAAALNLKRTHVVASVNGMVTNLDLHPGDFLAAGQQAMALIDQDSLRVEGYFEETKLAMICLGAPVEVRLMGEDSVVTGRVDSIAYGINDATRSDSGNLLPTIDPTFSWVRLPQRIPVRVKLEKVPPEIRLISGRTATVTIDPASEDQRKAGQCHHA